MKEVMITLLAVLLMISMIPLALAGTYQGGDVITYTVTCLDDNGYKDTGCTAPDDDILDPDDTTAKAPDTALAEVSDANFPSLWRGNYSIPAGAMLGTWSIFIELTNTNGSLAAIPLTFHGLPRPVQKASKTLRAFVLRQSVGSSHLVPSTLNRPIVVFLTIP